MADQATRGAARLAAFVAVPIALVVGLVAFKVLSGHVGSATPGPQATSPVPMAAPALADQPATICRALIAKLPGQIQGKQRRPVTAGPEQNAAYGDPAITLGCDAGPQPAVPATATVYPLSNVCWYAQTGKHSSTWTTLGRSVPVRITVPNGYDQPGQLVIEFSNPVAAAEPTVTSGLPTGCQDVTG
ncbi:DUF3515 family protein [Rugosimonospora africana]|uniref:DUF3515 domain-containing protein n=1 Tax=Rugosimonospora africana TaxID=556532 RepID=A0A8J3VP43_9ACTN|nr:DUF3515 family protein [Rugosimonospora africana]GIH13572.1 hypothetical protein Raf01_17440 [Rugosimonospora africana]